MITTTIRAHRLAFTLALMAFILGVAAFVSGGCGTAGAGASTSTASLSTTTPAPATTVAVSTDTSGSSIPQTTVATGTTLPGGAGPMRTLTFVGHATIGTWQALREIVINAASNGQTVLDQTAKLSAGPSVKVGQDELDAVSGIGFGAGADTSQPIAVAVGDDGREVLVFAFTVTAKPQMTTIVGFERYSQLVVLVQGPLPISSTTGNITTIPSP